MAAERVRVKKGFEYKMSKKVAELTQVVHMLFMRNHEREVEIQLTKELYDQELDRLHKKYQTQISKLEEKIQSLEGKTKLDQLDEGIQAKIDQALHNNEARWIKKYDATEAELNSERDSNTKLKELVMRLQDDINNLKSSGNESSLAFSAQLSNKENEIERLHKHMSSLEKKLADQSSMHDNSNGDLKKIIARLESDTQQMRSMLDEAQMNEDRAQKRAQQLESDLKSLKKDLYRKSTEMTSLRRSATIRTPPQHQSTAPQEVYEELENLRRLVQKYRLELSNREGNFNRMFTDKTPINLEKPRNGRNTLLASQTTKGQRDKSFAYALGQNYGGVQEPDNNYFPSGDNHQRVDSSMGVRRANSTLTNMRRTFQPPVGRQLLSQYSHGQQPAKPQPPEKKQNIRT